MVKGLGRGREADYEKQTTLASSGGKRTKRRRALTRYGTTQLESTFRSPSFALGASPRRTENGVNFYDISILKKQNDANLFDQSGHQIDIIFTFLFRSGYRSLSSSSAVVTRSE